jgi:hypothetical protein
VDIELDERRWTLVYREMIEDGVRSRFGVVENAVDDEMNENLEIVEGGMP